MKTLSPAPRSPRGLGLACANAFFLALAFAGCAASGSAKPEGSGGQDGGTADGGGSGGSSASGGHPGSGGSSSSASGGRSGSGGTTGGGSGGATATGGSGAAGRGGESGAQPCRITLTPLSPATSQTVDVGPAGKLQIQGVLTNSKIPSPSWTWTVTSPTLATIPLSEQKDSDGPPPSSVVTFPVATEGRYQILARTSDAACGQNGIIIMGVVSKPSFNLRVTAADYPVQEKRIVPSDSTSVPVVLDRGTNYRIEPRQVGQTTVMPAYLRITNPTTTFDVEGYTARGAVYANLISNFTYDLLVVPNDPTFAPDLFRSVTPDLWSQPITLDQGILVSGLVLGPDGAPLANARMILKLDGRPSTVGTSNASGALTLWTRSGNMSAIVVPPEGSGLPQAQVDATSGTGVNLATSDSSVQLTMQYRPTTMGALSVTVLAADGVAPVAGTRVRLSSPVPLSGIGTLTSHIEGAADVTRAATGSLNKEVISDGNGTANLGSVPAGSYNVIVVPPSSGAGALTSVTLTVPSAGVTTKAITLARKILLTGALATPSGSGSTSSVAGASITALDKTGDIAGSVASTTADASGAFTLQVDPNRTYQLIIQPRAGQPLGRMVVGGVMVGATDTPLMKTSLMKNVITLPPGLTVTGAVSGSGTSIVGSAFLQVFCVSSATWCPDATVSLAEGTTNPDGTFSFVLPNPAP